MVDGLGHLVEGLIGRRRKLLSMRAAGRDRSCAVIEERRRMSGCIDAELPQPLSQPATLCRPRSVRRDHGAAQAPARASAEQLPRSAPRELLSSSADRMGATGCAAAVTPLFNSMRRACQSVSMSKPGRRCRPRRPAGWSSGPSGRRRRRWPSFVASSDSTGSGCEPPTFSAGRLKAGVVHAERPNDGDPADEGRSARAQARAKSMPSTSEPV